MSWTIPAALGAWIPATMILFRAIGPRKAAPIALFGAFLLLPREITPYLYLGPFPINKNTVSGLALLAGVLVSDPRTLLRARPSPLDVPMILFVVLPLASLAANGFADYPISIDHVSRNLAGWALPYLIGRLYFADREGPRRLAVAITLAGLASLPIFGFEMAMGPRWYLAGLVYGIAPYENMVSRLGGWRPEGYLDSGLEVATWLALSATAAAWLWLRGGWRSRKVAAWAPALVLSLATIATRGVYGYANIAIGMATVGIGHFARTRVALILLAAVPPAYVVSRITGVWDGSAMTSLAARAGRGDTVAYRLGAEAAYMKKVADHNLAFGFGGTESAIFDFWSQRHLWPDGWWIHQLRAGGVVGLTAFWLASFLIPAALGIALPAGRTGGATPGAMARGLSLLLLLHALDSVHNMNALTQTPLIGGSLVGLFLARRSARVDQDEPGTASSPRGARTGKLAPFLITAAMLVALEILGRWPMSAMLAVPSPTSAAPTRVEATPSGLAPSSR